jgi:RNA polymerase sigma factor (TIGR02999 family)
MTNSQQQEGEAGPPSELTLLLNRMQRGDQDAAARAASLVYAELHRIASRQMKRERPDHVLQTTALVHEAYMRLVGGSAREVKSRGHFFAVASQQMRRILVEFARRTNALKRGSGELRENLDSIRVGVEGRSVDLLALDESLEELERLEPRAARVVEMRYFGGHTDRDMAAALGVSVITVRRDWEYARSWLFSRMRPAKKT